MTFKVGIQYTDVCREGIVLAIGRQGGDIIQVVSGIGVNGPTYETIAPFTINPHTLFLPDEIALPLLNALAAHYGGTSDMRTLRADYVAERARVDKFIDAAIRNDSI